MQHLQTRQETHLHHLLGHAESTRDQRLRSDHGRSRRQTHQWHQQPIRGHHVKRIFHSFRIGQQQRTLAEVVQHQAGHDHRKPSQTNGLLSKVPHVCVQGFAACHAQHHCAQNQKSYLRLGEHETQRMMRTQGPQDFWMVNDVIHTQCGNDGKPHQSDGAKKFTNATGAVLLHKEQTKQNEQSQRDHITLKAGRHYL